MQCELQCGRQNFRMPLRRQVPGCKWEVISVHGMAEALGNTAERGAKSHLPAMHPSICLGYLGNNV